MTEPTKQSEATKRRVVGLDAHPDSFAAALLEGNDAENARVVRSTTRQPLGQGKAVRAGFQHHHLLGRSVFVHPRFQRRERLACGTAQHAR